MDRKLASRRFWQGCFSLLLILVGAWLLGDVYGWKTGTGIGFIALAIFRGNNG